VVLKQYLPFSTEMLETHFNIPGEKYRPYEDGNDMKGKYIYEPTERRVFKRVINHLLEVLFTEAFYELKASEYSSRMIAMQNATDNADELVDKLTLDYNKARQAKITQELTEISGAMAAM